MRKLLPLVVCAGFKILCGQTLPSYLLDTFPSTNAFSVPVNVNIVLRAQFSLPVPPWAPAGYYTLKPSTGAAVSFTSNLNCTCFETVLIPSAPLAPNTLYTFTINPGSAMGDPYSFSFTTGDSADKSPPMLIGVDPPSGSSGLGLNGPFKFQFSKRITRTIQQGIILTAMPSYMYAYFPTATLSNDGTTLTVSVSVQQGYPTGYTVTLDPTQFVDAYGNSGAGAPMTANYTTFVAIDLSGPHLKVSLPSDGDSNVPTNVLPRLIFQKSIDLTTLLKGVVLQAAGAAQNIAFTVNSPTNDPNGGTALSIVPTKLLTANQAYTITVNSNLRDPTGFQVQTPQTIQFTTGSGPDVIAPAVLAQSPSGSVPPNAIVLIRTNKRIASIVPDRLATAGLSYGQFGGNAIPVSVTLSADGTLLTLVPQSPLPAEYYTLDTSDIVDTAGAPFFNYNSGYAVQFNVTGAADDTQFALLAVNPPADTTGVPASTVIRLLFNKPCATCLFPGAITVSDSNGPLTTKVTADYGSNAGFTVNAGALAGSTTYTVLVAGVMDLAGNPMADYSFSFTTASGPATTSPLTLLDSSVNNGDTFVDASGGFLLHYDVILNPVAAITSASLVGPANYVYPVTAGASGSTLTVMPVSGLPANTTFKLSVTVYSVTGGYNNVQISFTTAPSADTTQPTVIGILPVDGATLPYGSVTFAVTFSKPINPSTLTTSSLSVYSGGYQSSPTLVRSEDNQSVSFTMAYGTATPFSVIASADIKDLAGNSLAPFEANYQSTASTLGPGGQLVHEMRPANGATGVAANTTITWFLDQAVDLAAVQADLLILVNNSPFPGSFDLSTGGRVLRFTPAADFPAGAAVTFYERDNPTLLGLNQYNTTVFTIASASSAGLKFLRTTIGYSALDAVFELEFNQDPPLGRNLATLTYSSGHGDLTPVAVVASIPRPHILRFTTTTPRQPGYYNFTLGSQLTSSGAPIYLSATLSANPVGGSPTVQAAGPVSGAAGVALNASPRILFGAAINPLTIVADSATISAGGSVLAVQRTFPQNNQEIILTPVQALPANSTVTVALTGLQDLAGNPIPDASWSFTTGSDVDFTAPLVLSTSLPLSGIAEIAANEAVQVVFSKPIDPGITANIGFSGWMNNAATLTLSGDLQVLTIAPLHPWAEGQQYSINLGFFTDLSGNTGSFAGNLSSSLRFQVAFEASLTPPNLTAVSPPDGSTRMPLNAKIVAAFDKPVYAPPGSVILTDGNGAAVPLQQLYWPDAAILVFAPVYALRADTSYSVSISGIADFSGNAMTSGVTAGFVTSETPDYVSPSGSIQVVSPDPTNMPLRFRFNKAISPATLSENAFQLYQQTATQGRVPQAIDAAISSDDLSITVTPRQPLSAGLTYLLQMSYSPADFAGNRASVGNLNGTLTFVAGNGADTTPPVVTIFPPDGTTGFPVSNYGYYSPSTGLSATFSKPADLYSSQPLMQVLQNGNPVAGSVNATSTSITFSPSTPLQYGATYQIQVSGVVDYIGNAAPVTTSTFTTSQSSAADQAAFHVSSIQPADGSVGVDNHAPIVVAFNKVVSSQVEASISISSSSTGRFSGQWSLLDAYTVQFTPDDAWPSATNLTVTVARSASYGYTRDASGIILDVGYSSRFTTAVSVDTTPLTLVSITPAAGTSISPTSTTFTLVFSKPVVLGSEAIQAFNGSQSANVNVYYGPTSNVVTATVYAAASTVLTLVGTNAIADEAGNSIAPFSFQYPTLESNQTGPPAVTSISPSYASPVAPDTPVKIQFNEPMDPASLPASVRVTQDGSLITGQLQVLDSNQAVQFSPDSAYNGGSRIDVFVLTTATNAIGVPLYQRYQTWFMVTAGSGQATRQQRMSVALAGFGETVDPAAALELAFDRELDAATVEENVWLRVGRVRIPGAVALRGSRAIRFTPSEPLRIGEQYVLTAGPELRSAEGLGNQPREFRFRADPGGPEASVELVEYVGDAAPLAVRIRFSAAVNPISVRGLKVLAADGSNVPFAVRFSTDGREWLLALPSSQAVRVVLEGVEDLQGRSLPSLMREPVTAR